MPFKVIKVENKPRYYVEYSLFDKDATKKIAEAIFKDGSLSETYANKLVDLFLLKTVTPEEATTIKNHLNRKSNLVIRQSEINAKHTLSYEMIRDEQLRFTFKTNTMVNMDACSSNAVWNYLYSLRQERLEDDRYCGGIVYDVYPQGSDIDICVFLPDIDGAVIINIDNIIVKKGSKLEPQWTEVDYEIISNKYESIDDMVNSYYKGQAGIQYDISFKYCVGSKDNINERLIERRKKEYERFFSCLMEYHFEERDVIQNGLNGEERHLTAVDLYSSVRCSFSAFKKWYWEYGLYENLVVLSPKIFNNRLLSLITKRFQKRLEKYGETQEEREARMREAREQREARFRARRREREDNNNNNDGGN